MIVKKNPIDAKVKSLQDQLAAAHAQNERDGNEIKSLRAEVAQVKEEKDAQIESLKAEVARLTAERAAALVANAQPAAGPTSLVPVAQGGLPRGPAPARRRTWGAYGARPCRTCRARGRRRFKETGAGLLEPSCLLTY